MYRVSKQLINNTFKIMCDELGERVATSYNDVGALRLDYVSMYGGWNIERIITESGAINHPFEDARRSNRDMVDFMFSVAMYFARKNQEAKV